MTSRDCTIVQPENAHGVVVYEGGQTDRIRLRQAYGATGTMRAMGLMGRDGLRSFQFKWVEDA